MEIIVAVYNDWGIGKNGTQPLALSADRKFFREKTKDAAVIVGRKTLEDFPGGRPLPNRVNIVLTRGMVQTEGVAVCHSPEEAFAYSKDFKRAFVIGGGSVYRQMLPLCERAYVTKVHAQPESDTFFPDLDQDPNWRQKQVLCSGTENGISYEMCLYERNSNS